jgi:hypothetical protein
MRRQPAAVFLVILLVGVACRLADPDAERPEDIPGMGVPATPGPTATTTPSPNQTPNSRASGRIAFVRVDPDSVREGELPGAGLFVVNRDGSGLAEIGPIGPFSAPAWSPDGSRIALRKAKAAV